MKERMIREIIEWLRAANEQSIRRIYFFIFH